eukprot:TRINITY_DN749_c0_g1_i3.p4 TRINITY_DN749_c0_g1~~TRINITY_DN749_c0_g1_i3.p4  ORF type:complete len:132 (+),score=40.69 TRINITY_DN749_c0_g1_i3:164-559(+)
MTESTEESIPQELFEQQNMAKQEPKAFPESEVPFIGSWDDAPEFLQDNEYIHTGYRVSFNTVRRVLRSLFMAHNESVNVWSHLVGAGIFLALTLCVVAKIESTFAMPTFSKLKDQFGITVELNTTQSATIQ